MMLSINKTYLLGIAHPESKVVKADELALLMLTERIKQIRGNE